MKLVPASSLALAFSPLAACVGEKGWALLVTGILLLLEVSCPLGCGYFVVMESEKEKSTFQCCSLLVLTGGEPRTLPRPLLETSRLLQQGPVNDSIDLCCLEGETEASREAGCEHMLPLFLHTAHLSCFSFPGPQCHLEDPMLGRLFSKQAPPMPRSRSVAWNSSVSDQVSTGLLRAGSGSSLSLRSCSLIRKLQIPGLHHVHLDSACFLIFLLSFLPFFFFLSFLPLLSLRQDLAL